MGQWSFVKASFACRQAIDRGSTGVLSSHHVCSGMSYLVVVQQIAKLSSG